MIHRSTLPDVQWRALLGAADARQRHRPSQSRAPRRLPLRLPSRVPRRPDPPRTLFVAESRVLAVLDGWLSKLSAKNLDETVAEMLQHATGLDSEPPEVRRARQMANQAQNKLTRYLDAIEKGMDPALYVERSRTAQTELATAMAVIQRHGPADDAGISEDDIRRLLARLGSIVGLLHHASPDERRQFYQELGLHLAYQQRPEGEKIRASLGVEFSRVGGGTWYITPHTQQGPDLDLCLGERVWEIGAAA